MQKSIDNGKTAYYHLPGLFEFYDLYKAFLPIFYNHREYFYEWCEIGSIYGAPADCLWGGGRVGFGGDNARDVIALLDEYEIPAGLTFSNSLIREMHLKDAKCNELCRLFQRSKAESGVIIYSDLLLDYINQNYPRFYFVSSTTKVITEPQSFIEELNRTDFRYVVPDFRLNKRFDLFEKMDEYQKDKVELLCNECCWTGCSERKQCYENVSRKALGEEAEDHVCKAPDSEGGYRFSKAMENASFIGIKEIKDIYLPRGLKNFKIEGRSLGSAIVLEFLLYYMTKPEYQLKVREEIYLDNTLDLF